MDRWTDGRLVLVLVLVLVLGEGESAKTIKM